MKIINDPSVFNTADIFLFWDWSAFCPTQLAPKIFVSSWALVCLTSRVAQVGQSNWWVVGFFTKKRFACFQIIWNVMSVFLLHWTSSCYKFKLEKIFNVFSSYSWWLRCCWKICKLWGVYVYTRILTPALPQNAWKKLEQETKSKISQILVSAFFLAKGYLIPHKKELVLRNFFQKTSALTHHFSTITVSSPYLADKSI